MNVEQHLHRALAEADSSEVRYHLRTALQLLADDGSDASDGE